MKAQKVLHYIFVIAERAIIMSYNRIKLAHFMRFACICKCFAFKHFCKEILIVVFTRPLPMDGGMAEYHGAPEPGQLSRVWTRGRKETESRQRVSGTESP